MGDTDAEPGRLGNPMLWGFLSTSLLGVVGFFSLLLGAWPLLWLPMLAPVFALAYMRLGLHNNAGFGRFLAGYAVSLVTIVILGVLIIVSLM